MIQDAGQGLYALMLGILLTLVSGCASQPYHYGEASAVPVHERAISQTQGGVSISVAVPGKSETGSIFGVPLYQRGIQPVWLEIKNKSTERIRFAPTSLDPNYFSPLEVSYMHRKGFSKEARSEMDQRFHDSAMPRQIPAGKTRSGYVFTHAGSGTKSFNIDLFGGESDYSFAFFVDVPGFVPDHAEIDFYSLYAASDVRHLDQAGLRPALREARLTTSNHSGQLPGLPIGIIIVGDGEDVLKALLRAGWYESPRLKNAEQQEKAHYLYGRTPDAVFRIQRNKKTDRNELYLWMTPMLVDGKSVWAAQVRHFIGQRTHLEQAILGAKIDPDIDEGRNYFAQNMWYSQSLEKLAWVATDRVVSIENSRTDFNGSEYFTSGIMLVSWLSGTPVSLIESEALDWDEPSFRR